jgi:nuclear pore complex protein Nup107
MAEDKLMQQKAQLLLDEAASWSLLWYLYGKGNTFMINHLTICYIDSFSLQ